ncbi:iron uptake porin [Spirulina subsalsa FACHB-351]|uniref:Iron uptake porin n=1 Tax=Spirulina subsalsa FACHB-351 TaxID=234711 RepID=A0ABT3L9A0_9CYAN|nr:iron uptake porin [Spirulina subsalsa]MCW6038092.1 iron uptake porin [Spirulina subsalsa FACHB-351]
MHIQPHCLLTATLTLVLTPWVSPVELKAISLLTPEDPLQDALLPQDNSAPSLPQINPIVNINSPILTNRVIGDDPDPMAQITPVSQLRDIQPGDWAYQALNNLIERYNCLVGYPDSTFRGNRPLSRYEFAAGLNTCLQTLERLLPQDWATREELETLTQLTQQFEAELATLSSRLDALESRVTFLEDYQFSRTTKLYGQVVFGLQGRVAGKADLLSTSIPSFPGISLLGRDGVPETPNGAGQITWGYNAQLTLLSQFSPRHFLLMGLQAGNLTTTDTTLFGLNNSFSRLGYELNTQNNLLLSDLTYRQLVTDDLAIIIGPSGVNPVSVFRGPSRIESAGFGPISRFAQRNPILQIGSGNAGLGFDWQISPNISLQGVYAATLANEPTQGLFSGPYTAGVQLFLTPVPTVDVALNYLHSYSGVVGGFLGTGVGDDQISAINGSRLLTNAFGATVNWEITPWVEGVSWLGLTDSRLLSHSGRVQTVNWMFGLQFPDLFGQGNYGGVFFGQPPRVTGTNLRSNGQLSGNVPSLLAGTFGATNEGRQDRTLHLEVFYRWRVTDNISVTPGVVVLLNPGHNRGSNPLVIGALRTTFSF